MNFQQLRIIREMVKCDYNLTQVGYALFTSQSGVSKHIQDLEDELGVALFVRKGKRLLGLTEPGKDLLVVVERMLHDAHNIKTIAEQYTSRDEGELTIVTTHTQSRYVVPPIVQAFKQRFPKVHLRLLQAAPQEIAAMLLDGRADIGIATESLTLQPEITTFPYYSWYHSIVVPLHHPLTQLKHVQLADIAKYPLITYIDGHTGRSAINQAFDKAELQPDIVVTAVDSDVIKTYVELGMGVGIIADMAFQSNKEQHLTLLKCEPLFEQKTTLLAVRQGHFLRGFGYQFLEMCNPSLSQQHMHQEIQLTAAIS